MLGIKLIRKKDGGLPTKDQLRVWAEKNVSYSWPVKVLKSGPRKSYSVVDGIICKRSFATGT